MRLLALRMQNFRSFAVCELDLNADGLIAVVGPNGAGKSTIFAAVEWALYGGSRGRGSITARRYGCPDKEPCFVELDFEAGGRSYTVRRVDGKDARLVDLDTGVVLATSLTGVTREATTRLGLTHEAFCSTFYARQREVQALDSAKAPERRAQLERLLGIEQLRYAGELAARDAKEQKVVVDALGADAPDVDALRRELAEIEREAQQTAPAVQEAQTLLERVRGERTAAREHADALAAQARLAAERTTAAERAAGVLATAQVSHQGLLEQIEAAEKAEAQLTVIAPRAARVEELAAREREFDLRRDNYERVVGWRERQREALQTSAELSDALVKLPVADRAADELAAEAQRAQDELEVASATLLEVKTTRASAATQLKELEEALDRADRAVTLDQLILGLGDAEADAQAAREQWHKMRADQATLRAMIEHDRTHREAIISNGKTATCPACKRPYEGDWEEILAAYERDLSLNESQLDELVKATERQEEACVSLEEVAQRARELRAERASFDSCPDIAALREAVVAAAQAATDAAATEVALVSRHGELSSSLPELRRLAAEAWDAQQRRLELVAARDQAQRDANVFDEQLSSGDENGYDPSAHEEIREQLAGAREALQESAALRAQAEGLDLLRRRALAQQQIVTDAEVKTRIADEAVETAAVDPEMLEQAQMDWERLDAAADEAQAALTQAEQQALLDSQAVTAAQVRLMQGRASARRLQLERREWRWRNEVAAALSAYREDASRRARPTVEAETSVLLSRVTRGRYGSATLNDSYLLEIVDGGAAHPLRRFSGGEQDLASLCLRLALSRTLARQRGAEAGFVILDEVFGSQDADRRATLLEQLRALAESDFRQLFVVSHTDEVTAHCDLAIRVNRDREGLSVADGPK